MKPIEQDIIDFADDFFFHLSHNQVNERMAEFSKKQEFLCRYLSRTSMDMSGDEPRDILLRLLLVFDHCYNSYHVKINLLSLNSLKEYMDWQSERLDFAENKTKGILEVNIVEYINIIGEMGQDSLLNYLQNKIGICMDKKLFTENDKISCILDMMMVGFLYQQEIKKQFNDVN
jgi:hypothetical protein